MQGVHQVATKKRYIASISNSYFDVQIFHFIDNSVDVNTICASIIGSPNFVFDSELSDVKTPLFIKALTFEVDVQLHYGASIDMFLMLMNGNCNYDAAYSNISGKKLLYCYVNNKIRSKEYYFQIMDDGFDIKAILLGSKRSNIEFEPAILLQKKTASEMNEGGFYS